MDKVISLKEYRLNFILNLEHFIAIISGICFIF